MTYLDSDLPVFLLDMVTRRVSYHGIMCVRDRLRLRMLVCVCGIICVIVRLRVLACVCRIGCVIVRLHVLVCVCGIGCVIVCVSVLVLVCCYAICALCAFLCLVWG